MGRHMAVEAAIAIPMSTVGVPPIPDKLSPIPLHTTVRIGTSNAAVAVFEIKLESI